MRGIAVPTNMKAPARIALAALVLILIILVVVLSPRVREFEKFLSGVWIGESAFLKESGLAELYLYIAPREKSSRQGYLVMVDSQGEFVSNQGVEIDYACAFKRWMSALKSNFSSSKVDYCVPCAQITYDDSAAMPEEMSLGLDVSKGTLTLYDSEKIYAFLVKDNEVSMSANIQYSAE